MVEIPHSVFRVKLPIELQITTRGLRCQNRAKVLCRMVISFRTGASIFVITYRCRTSTRRLDHPGFDRKRRFHPSFLARFPRCRCGRSDDGTAGTNDKVNDHRTRRASRSSNASESLNIVILVVAEAAPKNRPIAPYFAGNER